MQEQALEVARVAHRVGGRGELDVVAAVVDEDRADRRAVEHRLQRLAEAVDVDAEVGGALAVDLDEELRLGGLVGEPHLAERRVRPPSSRTSASAAVASVVEVAADEGELQPLAGAADAERVRLGGEGCGRRRPSAAAAVMSATISCWLRVALAPGRQREDHEAAVVAAVRARRSRRARSPRPRRAAARCGPRSRASCSRCSRG